jgi:hypothetical protein
MARFRTLLYSLIAGALVALPAPAPATDVDGPDDCAKPLEDFGDAPEGIPCYPGGILGKFPTCLAPGPVGTMELACPPISTPPGPAGYVHHVQPVGAAPHYWLGCYVVPGGAEGIDSEPDGKVNTPSVGSSACHTGLLTDCVEVAFTPAMSFDQDECFGDGSDAGLLAIPSFSACHIATIKFSTANCGNQRQVFLNICVDMNADGDWNDNFQCPTGGCAYEWAVKNAPLILSGPGCEVHTSPVFLIGPNDGPSWMRVTISDVPMPDDFPWNGTASMAGGLVQGGETEDYPVVIATPTGATSATWGHLKMLYR